MICDGDDPSRPGVRTNCRPRDGSQFMVDVGEYTAFLKRLQEGPRDVTVAVVAGSPTPFEVRDLGVPTLAPSCQGPGGMAWPAVRLAAFADFARRRVHRAPCTQENAYQQITTPIVNRQRTCFPNLTKDDGEDCSVLEIVPGGAAPTELARCPDGGDAGAKPCWYTFSDEAACPDGGNYGIAVRRGTSTAASRLAHRGHLLRQRVYKISSTVILEAVSARRSTGDAARPCAAIDPCAPGPRSICTGGIRSNT